MKLNWQDKFVFHLINRVYDEEFVWNNNLPEFKQKFKKQQFFRDLEDEMNTMFTANVPFQYDEIMSKWNNLKSYFVAEKLRVDNAKERGVGEKSSWKFFEALEFLLVVKQQTTPVNNLNKRSLQFLNPLEDATNQSVEYMPHLIEEENDTKFSNSTFQGYSQTSTKSINSIDPLHGTRKRCTTDFNGFNIISAISLASPSPSTETENSCEIVSNAAIIPESVSTKKRRIKNEDDLNENVSASCAVSKNEKAANTFLAYIVEEIAKLDPDLQLKARKDMHNILIDLQTEQLKRNG